MPIFRSETTREARHPKWSVCRPPAATSEFGIGRALRPSLIEAPPKRCSTAALVLRASYHPGASNGGAMEPTEFAIKADRSSRCHPTCCAPHPTYVAIICIRRPSVIDVPFYRCSIVRCPLEPSLIEVPSIYGIDLSTAFVPRGASYGIRYQVPTGVGADDHRSAIQVTVLLNLLNLLSLAHWSSGCRPTKL